MPTPHSSPTSPDISLDAIRALARVPEHSIEYMRTVSGGTPFTHGPYLFFSAADWLMAVAYPLQGEYSHEHFSDALDKAIKQVRQQNAAHGTLSPMSPIDCWAVGPDLPPHLRAHIRDEDLCYTLNAHAPVPAALRGPLRKAQALLRVEESTEFTPEHRRLWAEFIGRVPLKANVRELFARTPVALKATEQGGEGAPSLRLLNAWDAEGHLAACLLMDYGPQEFCSYMLGAHSRTHYTPHAADLLFATMLESTRREGKRYVHLGVGVNEGITRFKRKWGGTALCPYMLAEWQEKTQESGLARGFKNDARTLLFVMAGQSVTEAETGEKLDMTALAGLSKRQIWATLPEQRPYAMLWQLEKNGKTSWIGGSAHFFCYSFDHSFRRLFDKVDTVLFEGPLDAESLAIVEKEGKTPNEDQRPLFDKLTAEEIRVLNRVVRGPEGFWPRFLNMEAKRKVDVEWYLKHARPWSALFTMWTGFLERKGWQQSVDLEACTLALEMGKTVIGMESLEEQIASLDSVPPERVVRYLQHCRQWQRMVQSNVDAYLAGDLLQLMGTSAEFPTRTERIISHRDERFRQRMRPFIEAGRCAVFVGTAHMLNLRYMLVEDGFTVTQVYPTFWHRLSAKVKGKSPLFDPGTAGDGGSSTVNMESHDEPHNPASPHEPHEPPHTDKERA